MPFSKDPNHVDGCPYCSYCAPDGKNFCFSGTRQEFQKMCYQNMQKHGMPWILAKFFTFMIRFAPEWKEKK